MPLFPCKYRSLCIDGPLSNLSAEGPEDEVRFLGRFQSLLDPPLDEDWTTDGCLETCISTISQEDADLCAERQAILCVYPFVNEAQTAVSNCPDGLPFSYTVPAGVFAAATVEEANRMALAYAQNQADARRICMSPLGECSLCINEVSYFGVLATNVPVGSVWGLSGNVPPGMAINQQSQGDAILQGVPTVAGMYTFDITIATPFGDFMSKTFILSVISIATTTLTPFQVGVPYSFQLQAVGGTGQYAWRLLAGTLPAGLVLDVTGLIHGSPTSATTQTVTFQVVDTGCITPTWEFYQPRVALTTTSFTRIATILGFPEYQGSGIINSVPPKKYKRLDFTGTSEQWGTTWGGQPCGRAKYEWSGFSLIDINGNFVSKYVKMFSADCPNPGGEAPNSNNDWPAFAAAVGPAPGTSGVPSVFKGYCWSPDPESCDTCNDTVKVIGDVSPNSHLDGSDFLGPGNVGATTLTATSMAVVGGAALTMALDGNDITNFPLSNVNLTNAYWMVLRATDNYTATLSEEYTDAEAFAASYTFNSNSKVAESRPRTTGYVSTWTSVNYRLAFTNLLVGQDYEAELLMIHDNGVQIRVPFSFSPDESTHVITGSVPTPADGHTIEVRSATVAYAPRIFPPP